jgi:dTDP-4-amino-4,6-dideoxygalactose transaminase
MRTQESTEEKRSAVLETGCFSFCPVKNIEVYGDGGTVPTNDRSLAERIRALRNFGQSEKYHHDIMGINSLWTDCRPRCESSYRDQINGMKRRDD